jgi:hypothetical protein
MMHFDGVLLMGICDKIQQERLEHLRIQFFLDVLGCSLNGGFNPYEVFFELLNKGLTLHYTESGDEFDEKKIEFNGDVKIALTRVEELLESDLLASKAFKNEKVKNQDGLEISVGDLLIKRSDIESIYAKYGETQYPWSLVAWPTSSNEWVWFPVSKGENINKNESANLKAEAVTIDISDPNLLKLQKQQAAILEACKTKKYNPLAIPDGGKGLLQKICEHDYPDVFDHDTSFDNAWKESKSLFRMANYASFAKRGKS